VIPGLQNGDGWFPKASENGRLSAHAVDAGKNRVLETMIFESAKRNARWPVKSVVSLVDVEVWITEKIAQWHMWGNMHDIHDGTESVVDSSIFPFFSSFFSICACLYPVEWSENRRHVTFSACYSPSTPLPRLSLDSVISTNTLASGTWKTLRPSPKVRHHSEESNITYLEWVRCSWVASTCLLFQRRSLANPIVV
jgi:hypothetical protein